MRQDIVNIKRQLLLIVSLIPIYSMSHDIIEIICRNKSIIIKISFNKHFLDFLISHILAQILCNLFKFQRGDFALEQRNKLQPCQYQRRQKPFRFLLYYLYHSFQLQLILETNRKQFHLIDLNLIRLKFDKQIYFDHQILNLRKLILIIVGLLYHLNHCQICRMPFLCLLLIRLELLKLRNLKHGIMVFMGSLVVILTLVLKDLMGLFAFLTSQMIINGQLRPKKEQYKQYYYQILKIQVQCQIQLQQYSELQQYREQNKLKIIRVLSQFAHKYKVNNLIVGNPFS